MTMSYDLYGAKKLSLLSAKDDVERALGKIFEERDSSYQGGVYYMWGRRDSEHFILKLNVDPFDGDPAEQKYPDHKILLYVNTTERSSDIEKSMRQSADFELLRHEIL
ncbi:hypothetical protein LOY70_04350 [Pseudomonas sp. B21-054]|uniref:hypothetical protein n=1 Tax=Pseudomonas sp. B21-054 TaxID=2895494 RepID=UPI00222E2495|nr:hypothetical protein [Pseudomonas sp. B21-054]UZE18833.1 hypothetical protein LOY70_04350 [Pseudomonas sp. B21-054]